MPGLLAFKEVKELAYHRIVGCIGPDSTTTVRSGFRESSLPRHFASRPHTTEMSGAAGFFMPTT